MVPSESAGVDLSVLVPSFGYGRFIGDALRSVLDQDGLAAEVIVHDAGSTDETLDVLRSFSDGVRWVSQPDDGQSDALNHALDEAQGRWVAWLNADEFYLPGGLKRLMTVGDEQNADVVYGDGVVVDETGRFSRLTPQHPFSPTVLRWYGGFLQSSSSIFRRSTLGSTPWDPKLTLVMDWDLYLRLHRQGAAYRYVKYPVGAFRLHSAQVTAGPPRFETPTVRSRYGISPARIFRRRRSVVRSISNTRKIFSKWVSGSRARSS